MRKSKFSFLLLTLVIILSLCLVFAGCESGCRGCNGKVKVDEFTLNYETKEIDVGETFTLEISESKYEGQVQFTSEDENIAIVSSKGIVTGVGVGTVKINATLGDYITFCTVTVMDSSHSDGESLNVVLSNTSLKIKQGSSAVISASVLNGPTKTDKEVTWSVDDKTKLEYKVDENNGNIVTVVALKSGKADLSATYGEFVAKCTISIEENVDFVFDKDAGKESAKISKNETKVVMPTIYVDNDKVLDAELGFESSDISVATVDGEGNIIGVGFGNAIIYITYGKHTFEYEVEVFDRIIETEIDKLLYDSNGGSSYSFTLSTDEVDSLSYPLDLDEIDTMLAVNSNVTYSVSVSGSTLTINGLPVGENEYYLYTGTTKFKINVCVASMVIGDFNDLIAFRNKVSEGANGSVKHVMTSDYICLLNDIDCGGQLYTIPTYFNVFGGVLDGRGYEIKNVEFKDGGLLQGVSGTVKNLGISFTATTASHFGAIAVELRNNTDLGTTATITDVFVDGEITATASSNVGGIISKSYAGTKISNSFARINLIKSGSISPTTGVISAILLGSLSNCYAVSNLTSLSASIGKDTKNLKTNYAEFIVSNIQLENFGDDWDISSGIPVLKNYAKNVPNIEITNTQTDVSESFFVTTNHNRVIYSIEGGVGVVIDGNGRVTFSSKEQFTFTVKATSIVDSTKFATKEFTYAGGLIIDMTEQESLFEINKNDSVAFDMDISEFSEYDATFSISSLTVGGELINPITYNDGKITLSASIIEQLAVGKQVVIVETNAGITYRFNLTIYNEVVVTTKQQFIDTFNSLYALGASNESAPVKIILGADIEFTDSDAALQRKGSFTFYGSIDGQGHYVKNLKIDTKTKASAGGLFGGCFGDITNIAFINVTVDNGTHGNAIGVLCSTLKAGATISNVFVSGTIKAGTANGNVGGIVWTNEGTVKNCIAVLETDNTGAYASAVVKVGSSPKNCYAISTTYKNLCAPAGTTCMKSAEEFFTSVTALLTDNGWSDLWKLENNTLSFGDEVVLSK